MRKPQIKPLSTEADIIAWVNEIIEPARADVESKRFIDIIFAVADPENNDQWNLAMAAAKEAYLLTTDFEESFRVFAGQPPMDREYEDEGFKAELTEITKEQ